MANKIGFIGTGLMGFQMAKRLIQAGHELYLYNRTKQKAEPLLESGAVWCPSPSEVALQSGIIFSMITNDAALEEISEQILKNLPEEGIHVDCSTISGEISRELEKRYRTANRYFIHSPVLGSYPQAENGTLLLFVGGNETAYSRVAQFLNILGNKSWYFEKAEQASYTKIIMNSFIGGLAATLVQGLVFAAKTGINGNTILEILQSSSLNSTMFQTKGKMIMDRNFNPRFYVENLFKDVKLMIDAAEKLGTPVPVAKTVKVILDSALSMGLAKEDYIALVKVLEEQAGAIVI